jgi:hypothetical protein
MVRGIILVENLLEGIDIIGNEEAGAGVISSGRGVSAGVAGRITFYLDSMERMIDVANNFPAGWQQSQPAWPWFRGEDSYPLFGYSEVFPPPRLVRKPYGTVHPHLFSDDDPHGWPVTEYEESIEILPGLRETASEVLTAMTTLSRGKPDSEGVIPILLHEGNPYWPDELARLKGAPRHERFVLILPLALSQTQDEHCRVLWTIFGGSEQGPGRAFWQSFATGPNQPWPEEQALAFFRRLLNAAYKEPERPTHDLLAAGLRFLPSDSSEFPGWDDGPLPSWTERFSGRRGSRARR